MAGTQPAQSVSSSATGPARFQGIVGDFDKQAAIMIGCTELENHYPEQMVNIVSALINHVPVVAVVKSEQQRRQAVTRLCDWGVPTHRVQFMNMPLMAMWLRDFGPQFVRQSDGTVVILDAQYIQQERTDCDEAPTEIAKLLNVPVAKVPLYIEGGNLLSNGRGFGLTTDAIIERNQTRGIPTEDLGNILYRYYGFTDGVTVLDRLRGDETGHVDMFAAFTAPDTVVMGQYDYRLDPENAEILDRNAARLAGTMTSAGPLKVHRVPMPTNGGGIFRTYTNVIFGNGVLLVPTYPGIEAPADRRAALETYHRLLPGWEIRGIEVHRLIRKRGALRCLSVNIPWLEHCFEAPSERDSRRAA